MISDGTRDDIGFGGSSFDGMMWAIVAMSMVMLLAGCATSTKYRQILDTWVGSTADRLVEVWGYPDATLRAPNGNTVYVYEYQAGVQLPAHTTVNDDAYTGTAHATTTGGGTITYWCKTFFEIDADHSIVRWQYRGNHCKAR